MKAVPDYWTEPWRIRQKGKETHNQDGPISTRHKHGVHLEEMRSLAVFLSHLSLVPLLVWERFLAEPAAFPSEHARWKPFHRYRSRPSNSSDFIVWRLAPEALLRDGPMPQSPIPVIKVSQWTKTQRRETKGKKTWWRKTIKGKILKETIYNERNDYFSFISLLFLRFSVSPLVCSLFMFVYFTSLCYGLHMF